MSEAANQDRSWGAKAMIHSDFLFMGCLLEGRLDDIPEGEFKGLGRMAVAGLKLALLDAEAEVHSDPDSLGPEQRKLFTPSAMMSIRVAPDDGSDEYMRDGEAGRLDMIDVPAPDTVALFCQILSIDTDWFREKSSSVLDHIADRVRAEREQPSAQVICIDEARQRRMVRAPEADAQLVFVPVISRRRMVGEQLAWIC